MPSNTPASPESREITLTRVYDAPVSAVWDAWTDPEQVAQWWGPRGFTLTTHAKDLRPGGTWRYTMHGPDGTDYPNVTRYYEVEKHALLVYDHGADDDRPPLFRVTARFTALGAGTRMDLTMALPTPEAARETRAFIRKAGGNGTWDRLAEHLAKRGAGKELFVIARSFEAPIGRVFEMWTDPGHFSKWLPPAGSTMEFISCDIRPGGGSFYAMTLPNGGKMHGKASYLEIRRPDRIVYTQQFCDEKGVTARHPFAPAWPETMLTTVTFEAEGPSRTRVSICWEPVAPLTPAELETFVKARSGMTQGWTGSLDKLEDLLGGSGGA
jgi:uncharacterized protein YndB with AHSA1/START domain